MPVFISYRRDDSGIAARVLYNELVARLGADSVFMDIDNIGYGDDFAADIDRHLARADVILVVIGPRWHQIIEQRLRGDDWVRHEVAVALQRRQAGLADGGRRPRVLPVQLDDTAWPGPALPEDLAGLQKLSALKLFKSDLKAHLNQVLEAVQGASFEDRWRQAVNRVRVAGRARLAAFGLGVLVFATAWLGLADLFLIDTTVASWMVALPGAPPPPAVNTVLVVIDEGTVRAVGRDFDASWRSEHARLVRRAAQAGARSLAFDVAMPKAAAPADDQALAQALAEVRPRLPVVLGVQSLVAGQPELAPALAPWVSWGVACAGKRLNRVMEMPLAVLPVLEPAASAVARLRPSLALAAFSGGGAVEALDLADNRLQVRVPAQQRSPFVTYQSLERVRTLQSECPPVLPGERVALHWVDPLPLRRPASAVPRVAYESLLAGEPAALAALAGRIAIVGVMLGRHDLFDVAGPGTPPAYGSELIAQQVEEMAQGRTLRPVGALGLLAGCLAAAGAGVSLALAWARRPAWQRRAGLAGLALLTVLLAWAWLRWDRQLLLPHHLVAALLAGHALTGRLLHARPAGPAARRGLSGAVAP